ncbi:MAG: isocitrate/isopropylmalate dehydrogenase family protein [Gemmatimonadales bacterium]|nr:MAG: isocitrate/isopropylmalate dehydrogenase family protein [Gemmatimonadales bacterium]
MARIAIIPGDGVGVEVMEQAVRLLDVLSRDEGLALGWDEWDLGADRYLRTGTTLTEEDFAELSENYDAILLGALGDPRVPSNVHARDILLGLRFRLDLYVNYRPCRLLHPDLSPLRHGAERPMDLHIFRENTEGSYGGLGGNLREGTPHELAIQEDVTTAMGVGRIVRRAFEFARERDRGRVTLVDKANAMPHSGRLWRRVFREIAEEFPELESDMQYVDAMAMDLIRNPDRHDVLVTSNLFGDILSDEGAALTGGMGLAPSANLNPGIHALFEPVHGSAPDIAGQGIANPMAAVRCVGLLMGYLGRGDLERAVDDVVTSAIAQGVTTPDLGGTRSTGEVGEWLADGLAELLTTYP